MIFTILLLIIFCLFSIKIGKGKPYEGYLSKKQTNAIKGIFIIIVFLSHIKKYILDSGYDYHCVGDKLFYSIMGIIGQLMVVMFLFYSGYGIMESIKKKGDTYTKAILRHRFLNTLVNFDIAVCVFLIVDLFLGQELTVTQILLSFLTWESIGNSNWYIFAILVCYFVTWLLTRVVKTPRVIMGHFLLLTLFAMALYHVRDSWWYNTLWAYPAGIFYSTYKKVIERLINKHYVWVLILLLLICFVIFYIPFEAHGFRMNLLSIFFAFLVVGLTMRVKINNRLLEWCGEELFPLYIYQRIPMMIIVTIIPSFVASYPLLYILACLIITVFLTYCYRFIRVSL